MRRRKFDFYQPGGSTLITTARGYHFPLTSRYKGKEVPQPEIKSTRIFFVFFDLSTKISLADEVHVNVGDTAYVYLVTSIKAFADHTEIVGLLQGTVASTSTETGIVSVWTFGDAAGGLGYDVQGGNPLTVVNTPAFSSVSAPNSDPQDGSVDFESTEFDRLEISDADQQGLDITGNITVVCRIKLESIGAYQAIISKSDNSSQRSFELWISSGDKINFALSGDGSSETAAIGSSALSSATWYSIGCVYDGTDIRIYLDGSLDSNGAQNPKAYTSGIFNSSAKFVIGARGDNANYYDGLVDDVRIYNVAKTATEISTWDSTGTT